MGRPKKDSGYRPRGKKVGFRMEEEIADRWMAEAEKAQCTLSDWLRTQIETSRFHEVESGLGEKLIDLAANDKMQVKGQITPVMTLEEWLLQNIGKRAEFVNRQRNQRKISSAPPLPVGKEIVKFLSRAGNNLNQIARILNTQPYLASVKYDSLMKALEGVESLLREVAREHENLARRHAKQFGYEEKDDKPS